MKKWAKEGTIEGNNKFDIYLFIYSSKMILRSGRMIGLDQVIINFDEASVQWRKNKIFMGGGIFCYKN